MNSMSVKGSWWFRESALKTLDELIKKGCKEIVRIEKGLQTRREKQAEDKAKEDPHFDALSDEEKQRAIDQAIRWATPYGFNAETEVTVTFTDVNGKEATGKTFDELIGSNDLDAFDPKNASVVIDCYGQQLNVRFPLSHNVFADEIQVSASESTQAQNLQNQIVNWAASERHTYWKQFWTKYAPFSFIIVTAIWLVGIIALSSGPKHDSYMTARQQAKAILDEGVNDHNRDKAVETMLRFSASQPTDAPQQSQRLWLLLVWTICAFPAARLVSYAPNTDYEIGKGKSRISRRAIAYRLVSYVFIFFFVTVPAGVLINFISSQLN